MGRFKILQRGLMNLVQPDDGFTQSREMSLLLCSIQQTCVKSDE